jgi:predicted PolB exonuclease-like 3'-5' exonuclease
MAHLFLDIETIPASERPLPEEVSVPGTYKDPVKIAEYQKANVETEFRKRAVITYKSQIICLAWAYDDEPVQAVHDTNEDNLLQVFFSNILRTDKQRQEFNACNFVGHNVMFDLKTIAQRCFKYGFNMSGITTLHAYSPRIIDTMKLFTLGDRQDYVSLDVIAKFLEIPLAKSMKGSEVYDEYLAGNIEKITEYCKNDVELTRLVYKKLT